MVAAFTKKRLSPTTTLGQKLTRARKRRKLDLRTAERETRVAMKYLRALEKSDYQTLPAPIYTRGFLTRYAAYLGLKPEVVLADYDAEIRCWESVSVARRSKHSEEGLLRPRVADEWLRNPNRVTFTPGLVWGSILSLALVSILGYLWFQVASFAAAPPLEIVTPGSELRVQVKQVEVAGLTDPMAELEINNQPVAVDVDGHFRQEVSLVDGVNTIEIMAKNKAEKETIKTIQLLADIPEPVFIDATTGDVSADEEVSE